MAELNGDPELENYSVNPLWITSQQNSIEICPKTVDIQINTLRFLAAIGFIGIFEFLDFDQKTNGRQWALLDLLSLFCCGCVRVIIIASCATSLYWMSYISQYDGDISHQLFLVVILVQLFATIYISVSAKKRFLLNPEYPGIDTGVKAGIYLISMLLISFGIWNTALWTGLAQAYSTVPLQEWSQQVYVEFGAIFPLTINVVILVADLSTASAKALQLQTLVKENNLSWEKFASIKEQLQLLSTSSSFGSDVMSFIAIMNLIAFVIDILSIDTLLRGDIGVAYIFLVMAAYFREIVILVFLVPLILEINRILDIVEKDLLFCPVGNENNEKTLDVCTNNNDEESSNSSNLRLKISVALLIEPIHFQLFGFRFSRKAILFQLSGVAFTLTLSAIKYFAVNVKF